jgi:hypothetical protein
MYNEQDIFMSDMPFSAQLADHNGWSYFMNPLSPSHPHSLYPHFDSPSLRARKAPPIPVPNLTKKSRGRRVPTITDSDGPRSGGITKSRTFRCNVSGCGKCFLRGEHLKRHVRSIHTYDKPFKCTIPSCGKHFSRRDNLVQHLKIHKDQSAAFSSHALSPGVEYSDRDDASDYQRASTSPVVTVVVPPSFVLPSTPTPPLDFTPQNFQFPPNYNNCADITSICNESPSSIALDYHYALSNAAPSPPFPLSHPSPMYPQHTAIQETNVIGNSHVQSGHFYYH